MSPSQLGVIELVGVPGSGKTTLAQALGSTLNISVHHETLTDNAFLDGRFGERKAPSLENDLSFLIQNLSVYYKMNGLKPIINDGGILLDLAYARATLDREAVSIYEKVCFYFMSAGFMPRIAIQLAIEADLATSRLVQRDATTRFVSRSIMRRLEREIAVLLDEVGSRLLVLTVNSSNSIDIMRLEALNLIRKSREGCEILEIGK